MRELESIRKLSGSGKKDGDGMETYNTQVIELLSLGKTIDGFNQMKLIVTQEERQATYEIKIDELTYQGLESLKPWIGDRVRLSPYAKWDPYQKTFYSSLIKGSGVTRDIQYFPCTEHYIQQLTHLRSFPLTLKNEEEQGVSNAAQHDHEHVHQAQFLRIFSTRTSKVSMIVMIIFSILAVFSTSSQGKGDLVRKLSEPIGIVKAEVTTEHSEAIHDQGIINDEAGIDLLQNDDIIADPSDVLEVSMQSSSNPLQADDDVFEITEEMKLFGLPEQYVALTFDDGPSALTEQIVDILKEQNVAATFLFVGQNVARNPDAVTYTLENGMAIGNHSWDHSVLTKADAQKQRENLLKTNDALESLTDRAITLFRPPYGEVNDELVAEAKKLNMKTLMWNRDPEDWNAKNPEDIIRYFHQVEAAGGIYVLHEDKNTVEALPEIIKYLKEKNLTFVTFK